MASPTVAANAYASLGRMLESGGGIGAGAGKATDPGGGQSFGAAFRVQDGTRHLVPAGPTAPRANPPAPAP